MSHNHSEHVMFKENVHTFYIGFDLDNSGNLSQVKSKFYDELFDDITAFAFGTQNVMKRIKTPQDVSKVQREAFRKMYSIPELKEASQYYLESDFVEDKYIRRGEFGELLLYHLLHEYFNADALISKIYFKDNVGLSAHGFDAVHVDSKNRILWIGESKLYSSGTSAIDELMKDLSEHFNTNFFDTEFTIIDNRVHDSGIELDDFMKELISPQTKVLKRLANINIALFAGFDSRSLQNYKDDEEFKKELDAEIQKLRERANRKIPMHSWNKYLNIYLFLFPIDNKCQFVKDLHLKLKGAQQI
ncbi:HamA C-terminal domain-containing protein [Streptococcus suis]